MCWSTPGSAPPRRRAGAGSVEEVVAGVAVGRAKRGRLVQALQVRPAALTDGRSPAPQVVGNAVHHTHQRHP